MSDEDVTTFELNFFKESSEVLQIITDIISENVTESEFDASFTTLTKILVQYQEQPQLLESQMVNMTEPLCQALIYIVCNFCDLNELRTGFKLHHVCKVLQLLCRVRGFKHIVKYLPHEVNQLEPCLDCLLRQNITDYTTWETRYILLLWLSVLSLIPFDICSMDSLLSSSNESKFKSSLVGNIVNICTRYTSDPGPSRVAASLCLSSLLTRPDMEGSYLSSFLEWSIEVLSVWSKLSAAHANSFQVIGVLHCVGQIFKHGHRNRLIIHASDVLKPCLEAASKVNNTLTKKLLSKLFQRIAMTFLPPRVALWRYTLGKRCLSKNLGDSKNEESFNDVEGNELETEQVEEILSVDLENILENLLALTGDTDTVVRWSAAKGIGRITMLLSKASADDILEAVIENFSEASADTSWHGGCLALAELSRRGLLLPERLIEVVPFIERAILFDIMRGQHSVGSHVRDAACYVCWSFSRAYSPIIMSAFSKQLSSSMLITALYDREVNCRRAAAAAFQENVGRQGNENFPFGIDVITIADYFSLGNRINSYLEVAPAIAAICDLFNESLLTHLCSIKIFHWDEEIRVLSSKAIAKLCCLNPVLSIARLKILVNGCVSPQLTIRHGSILAVAEMLVILVSHGVLLSKELSEQILNIVPNIEKFRLYRGKGGELIRKSVCFLIQSIAQSCIPVSVKMQVAMLESLNEQLRQPFEILQGMARDALRHVLYSYFSRSEEAPSDKLLALTVLKYINGLKFDDNVAVTRGCAMALGVLPVRFICGPSGMFDMILDALVESSSALKLIGGEYDAATCRNSVESMTELVERLCDWHASGFGPSQLNMCLEVLFRACDDYSMDKRGDTGSWSRIAGLLGIERVLYAVFRRNSQALHKISASSLVPGSNFLSCCGVTKVLKLNAIPVDSLITISCSTQFGGISKNNFVTETAESLVITKKGTLTSVFYPNADLSVSWISDDNVIRSLSVILKQLSEKLDHVREIAGNILHRISCHQCFKNCSVALIIQHVDIENINWANPDLVFPFVTEVMRSPLFIQSILSGLVVSVGGITESVAKSSTDSILKFCETQRNNRSGHWVFDELVGGVLKLFSDHKKNDRVICPLIKFVDLMIRKDVFNFDDNYVSSSIWNNNLVAEKLLTTLLLEMIESVNVLKLMLCLDVLVLLMSYSNNLVRFLSFKLLIRNLAHKYPKVRKVCAELLYLQILSDKNVVGKCFSGDSGAFGLFRTAEDAAVAADILVSVVWDKADKHIIISNRFQLHLLADYSGFNYEANERITAFFASNNLLELNNWESKSGKEEKKHVQSSDQSNSYTSLVKDAGY